MNHINDETFNRLLQRVEHHALAHGLDPAKAVDEVSGLRTQLFIIDDELIAAYDVNEGAVESYEQLERMKGQIADFDGTMLHTHESYDGTLGSRALEDDLYYWGFPLALAMKEDYR